jgi:hypothetical protein
MDVFVLSKYPTGTFNGEVALRTSLITFKPVVHGSGGGGVGGVVAEYVPAVVKLAYPAVPS